MIIFQLYFMGFRLAELKRDFAVNQLERKMKIFSRMNIPPQADRVSKKNLI